MDKERIHITSDTPGFLKVGDIGKELRMFLHIIEKKYKQINFDFLFCFRALYTTRGIRSKVRFYKEDRLLGFDLIMPESDFIPYKNNVSMQRLIMGKHFFPFFASKIKNYKNKLPTLKLVVDDLIEDMRLFLVENLWLPDDNGHLRLSVIENVSYERAVELFGSKTQKKFSENDKGQKVQDIVWTVEEDITLSVKYTLIDKRWVLDNYSIDSMLPLSIKST